MIASKTVLLALSAIAGLLVMSLSSHAAEPASTPSNLKVMSFNIRLGTAKDGDNAWPRRKDLLLKVVQDFNPDLLGMQEVVAAQYDEITSRLKNYTPVGVARDDGKRKGEWSLVLFRADRFALLDSGTFWLSEHPEQPGSKSWDAALTRICSYARLRDRVTGRTFLFANTHFDHRGPESRLHSAELLRKRLASLAKDEPILLTGDFNTHETTRPYAVLTAGKKWIDSYREVHPTPSPEERSAHGFQGGTKGQRIDFIFHTPDFRAMAADIVRTASADGHFPSDHYPVTAVLEWVKK